MRILSVYLVISWFILSCSAQKNNATSMETWQYPYPVAYVQTSDSTQIAYVDQGEGEQTLLFLHGLGSNLQAWQKSIDGFSDQYRCIALDLPAYGKSSKQDYPFSMTFFADEIAVFMQKMNLEKVTLVGHSMGGQIAIHLALKYAAQIDRLILIAPAGFEQFKDTEGALLKQVYTAAVVKATPEAQIVKNFELNFYEMPEDARFMIEDRLAMRQTAEYDYYCQMIPKCMAAMLDGPVFSQLPQLQQAILVIFGENDALIPNTFLHPKLTTLEVAKSGLSQLSKASLHMIPSAGHFVQWEQDEAVRAAIFQFLAN